MMDQNRKTWNENQKELHRLLSPSGDFQAATALFLRQHAAVHSAQLSGDRSWSFPEEILQDLSVPDLRRIPLDGEHSIAWVLWHLARIEDVTMNILVAYRPQLYYEDNWFTQMKFLSSETGNAQAQAGIASLSTCLDLDALHAYRLAVGRNTQMVVKTLHPDDLPCHVPPSRLDRVLAEGAVVESTRSLLVYWSKRTIAGLLLMPPTRHNFLHLNEAAHIRHGLVRSGI